MKYDGIAVTLRRLDGERIKEYDNGIDGEPHPDFDGVIGTRQIAVIPGTTFEVVVTLDEDFYPFSADGVWVEVYTGSPTSPLTLHENGQCWWIHNDRRSVSGTYTFSSYIIFAEGEDDAFCPFAIPSPDELEYANASHTWVKGDTQPLSKSSLVVYVSRGKWDPHDRHYRAKTEPLHTLRDPEPLAPVVIHHQWVRRLNSENGVPYIFEYINMGIDAIDGERDEADEELEYDDDDAIMADGEGDHDSDVDEDDGLSSGDDYFDVDGDSEFSKKGSIDDGSEYKPESYHGQSLRNKCKRHDSLVTQNSSVDANDENLPNGKSLIVTLKAAYRERRSACNADKRDDEEDLPSGNQATTKKEGSASKQPSRLRQTTRDDLGVESTLRTQETPESSFGNRRNTNIQTDTNAIASTPVQTILMAASTFPLPTAPSENLQRSHQNRRDEIDLISEPDEKPIIVKREATDTFSINGRGRTTMIPPAIDDEDSEDLADEARLIEIRRKLRAKKKRKRAAGQTTF